MKIQCNHYKNTLGNRTECVYGYMVKMKPENSYIFKSKSKWQKKINSKFILANFIKRIGFFLTFRIHYMS